MRRFSFVLAAVIVGVAGAGLSSAVAANTIVAEETIVVGEHTNKSKIIDLAGQPDDFKVGDRYMFRSELTDEADEVVGHLNTECVVDFAKRDTCSVVYELAPRGTIVAEGQVPVSELGPGGTWTYAILGGTGEFENVRGSVAVEVVGEGPDTEHSLHLLP
ncbi:MAG TPA: hypothetical protein VJ913_06680 [Actinomycetota bacterium]|nr:hypothetical protein [Actinomycetota bacterium]